MGMCPLCFTAFVCTRVCPECAVMLQPVCACGSEWQPVAAWEQLEIIFTETRIHRLSPDRCTPTFMQRAAQA